MTAPTSPESCVIYTRISLDRTGEQLGVERQESECRALAERNGWTVSEVYRDNDVSAFSGKLRPEFERLLADRPSRVVVWAVDRLQRSMSDLQRILDTGCYVHSVTAGPLDLSTPSGIMVAEILTSVSAQEMRQKAARQKAMHKQRRNAGKPWWSHRPFGYEKDGTIVEAEAEVIRKAFADMDRGVSRASIRESWNAEGILTSTGREWSPATFQSFIRSPRNAGMLTDTEGNLIAGQWEPIIDPIEWKRIMDRVTDAALQGRGQGKLKGLLSGLLTCAECGQAAYLAKQAKTNRRVYRTLCAHVSAPVDEVDRAVRNAVVRMLASPAAYVAQGSIQEDAEGMSARAEAKALRQRLNDLGEAFAAGEIDRQQLAAASRTLTPQLAEAEARAERSYQQPEVWEGKSPAELLAVWNADALDFTQKRSLMKQMFAGAELVPRKQGKPFDPARHLRLLDHESRHLSLPTNKRPTVWTPA